MKNKTIKIKKDNTKEILQKEWGVSSSKDARHIIATTNIVYCTGFYGHDINHEVGFLCHFDFPWSTGSLPCVFNELLKHIPKETLLQCYLIGGWSFMWSPWTRDNIKNYICHLNNCGWNILLSEEPYHNKSLQFRTTHWGKAIQFNVNDGHVTDYFKKRTLRKRSNNIFRSIFEITAKNVDEKNVIYKK